MHKISTNRIKTAFGFPTYNFTHIADFIDGSGFSIRKDLEYELIKKLKLEEDKNYVSILCISISKVSSNKTRLPLILTCELVENRDETYVINFEINKKYKQYAPISIYSENDYFYDVKQNKFYFNESEIKPIKILVDIYEKHIKPSKLIKGLLIRSKVRLRFFISRIIQLFAKFSLFLFNIISWEKYKFSFITQQIIKTDENSTPENISCELTSSKPIKYAEIFGIQIEIRTAFWYAAVNLLIFIIYYLQSYLDIHNLNKIVNNAFLISNYAIFSVVIFKYLLDKVIKTMKLITEKSWNYYYKSLLWKIKV
jgi:hypothetical protein